MLEEQFRGYIIQVGKDENENDELIAKASPEDYWLHLSNVPFSTLHNYQSFWKKNP